MEIERDHLTFVCSAKADVPDAREYAPTGAYMGIESESHHALALDVRSLRNDSAVAIHPGGPREQRNDVVVPLRVPGSNVS